MICIPKTDKKIKIPKVPWDIINLWTVWQIPFINVAANNFDYNSTLIRHNITGNIGINSPIDFGYKLDVGGSIRIADGGNISGTILGTERITMSSVNGITLKAGTIDTAFVRNWRLWVRINPEQTLDVNWVARTREYFESFWTFQWILRWALLRNNRGTWTWVWVKIDFLISWGWVITNSLIALWEWGIHNTWFAFHVSDGTNINYEAMRLTWTGRLWIFTNNPQEVLDVNGDILLSWQPVLWNRNIKVENSRDITLFSPDVSWRAILRANNNYFYVDAFRSWTMLRLGLGTATPSKLLHVLGTGANGWVLIENNYAVQNTTFVPLQVNGTDSTNNVAIYLTTNQSTVSQRTSYINYASGRTDWAQNFELRENEITRFRVSTGGNVGIGTINPIYKADIIWELRVWDNVSDNSKIRIWWGLTTTQSDRLLITPFEIRLNANQSFFKINSDNLWLWWRILLYWRGEPNYPWALSLFAGTSTSNVIHMADNGKVSIWYRNWPLKFNVLDWSATFVAQFRGSNATYVVSWDVSLWWESWYVARNSSWSTFISQASNWDFWIITTSWAKDIYFATTGLEAMRIKSSTRNVLIWTQIDTWEALKIERDANSPLDVRINNLSSWWFARNIMALWPVWWSLTIWTYKSTYTAVSSFANKWVISLDGSLWLSALVLRTQWTQELHFMHNFSTHSRITSTNNFLIWTQIDSWHKIVSSTGTSWRVAMFGNIEFTNWAWPSWTWQGFRCDWANQPIQYIATNWWHQFYTVTSVSKALEIEPIQGNTIVWWGINNWSKLQVKGSVSKAITTTTTNIAIDNTHYTIICDANSWAITATLPTAVGIAGREYVILKADNSVNIVTLQANWSETINWATTQVLSSQYDKIKIITDWIERFIIVQ